MPDRTDARCAQSIRKKMEKILQLEEQPPRMLNPETHIFLSSPKVLHMTLPMSAKEQAFFRSPVPKRYKIKTQPREAFEETHRRSETAEPAKEEEQAGPQAHEEEAKEALAWDVDIDNVGRFDHKGNFVVVPDKDSDDGEDWVVVKSAKEKKRKEGHRREIVSNLHARAPPGPEDLRDKAASHAPGARDRPNETDSDGFTVVRGRKPKPAAAQKK